MSLGGSPTPTYYKQVQCQVFFSFKTKVWFRARRLQRTRLVRLAMRRTMRAHFLSSQRVAYLLNFPVLKAVLVRHGY